MAALSRRWGDGHQMAEFWLGDSNGPMGDVGAFMASELRVDRADLPAHIRQLGETGARGGRLLVALAGAHAAGTVQLGAELAQSLNARAPGTAATLAQHMFCTAANDLKTAPEDFDPAALLSVLQQLAQTPVAQPLPKLARFVPALVTARMVVVTGPFLLLTRPLWRDLFPLFDLTIRLATPGPCEGRPLLRENRAADLVVTG